ncbi:MAG: orotidine-5'-phosphate decarboxylase [Elusimicrobia bacterium]|nr:orotidine-5'-phosphate decarboxylase [Elusimicrobiota bacterium]
MTAHEMEVIVALDTDSLAAEEDILRELRVDIRHYKVGLRLFTAHGCRAIELVHRNGGDVFLDLKLHDIPQTVAHTVHEAQKLGVFALSVHLSGGLDMLRAAADVHPRPKLWGVAVLTSLSDADVKVLHPRLAVHQLTLRLAALAKHARLDGIICSGREVPLLREALGPDACFICPGIRQAGREAHDQKRIITPADAARLGVRYAVIGRPITHAEKVKKAAQGILEDIRNAGAG